MELLSFAVLIGYFIARLVLPSILRPLMRPDGEASSMQFRITDMYVLLGHYVVVTTILRPFAADELGGGIYCVSFAIAFCIWWTGIFALSCCIPIAGWARLATLAFTMPLAFGGSVALIVALPWFFINQLFPLWPTLLSLLFLFGRILALWAAESADRGVRPGTHSGSRLLRRIRVRCNLQSGWLFP
jgi:hypothetical protein